MQWQRDNNLIAKWLVPRRPPKDVRAMQTWQSGGQEPVPPEVPVFPTGTMVPGSNFGHRQRA